MINYLFLCRHSKLRPTNADRCGQQDGKINVPKYGDLNNHLRSFVANTDNLNSKFLQIRANSGRHNSIKGNSGG